MDQNGDIMLLADRIGELYYLRKQKTKNNATAKSEYTSNSKSTSVESLGIVRWAT